LELAKFFRHPSRAIRCHAKSKDADIVPYWVIIKEVRSTDVALDTITKRVEGGPNGES